MVVNSNSWKATKPLRLIGKFIRWFVTGIKHWVTFSPTSRPRRVYKQMLISLKHRINANPKLKLRVIHFLNYFPGLKVRLKNIRRDDIFNESHERDELTLQAQEIYDELKQQCNNIPHIIQENKNQKMAIVTPIPPDKTGIADYISELLPSLSKIYDIEIITDTVDSFDSYPVHNIEFFENNAARYNRIIYQVGNSPYHWYMFDLIKKFPGIIVLHDFYLGNIIHWIQENKNSYNNIWDTSLLNSHGYSSVYMRSKKGVAWTVDHYPTNVQILQSAKGIIVHSKYAKTLSTDWYGQEFQDKFYHLPQVHKEFTEPKILNSKTFLVCSFGHIIKHKLIHRIISAWINTGLHKNPNSRLVFVGNCGVDEYGLKIKKLVKPLANVEITGFIEDKEFHNYLINTNVAIQLREESKGETSRAVLDCMSYGIPTIVNENGSMVEFPDHAVLKIKDKFNEDELGAALNKLYEDKALCNKLSQNAKSVISQKHKPEIVSKQMQNIVEEIYNKKVPLTVSELYKSRQKGNTSISDQELSDLAKEYEINLRSIQVPNLYIDISVIAMFDLKTGIQRVVRSILISFFQMPTNSFKIVPVYLTDQGGYWHYRTAHNFMKSLVPDMVSLRDTVIEPSASEIFIGLDFYAGAITETTKIGLFDLWKKRGVSINFVVYDILPIQFPDFFPAIAYDAHRNWLNAVGRISDNILCISKTVANDVKDYLIKSEIEDKSLPNIDFFHLGADIENSIPSKGLPEEVESLLTQFASHQSFLMLGTLEPRKGHMQTLLAFEELWKNNIDVNLIIVGKEGWSVEELTKKIRKHPDLNKKLFWIEGASDEYLEKIYAASTCLIAASEGEGFGLPLIEAAQHKLPIIARDIPVFKEVAKEYAFYFDNDNDPIIIEDTVKQWLSLNKFDEHPKSNKMPWLTWKESTKQLLNCLEI